MYVRTPGPKSEIIIMMCTPVCVCVWNWNNERSFFCPRAKGGACARVYPVPTTIILYAECYYGCASILCTRRRGVFGLFIFLFFFNRNTYARVPRAHAADTACSTVVKTIFAGNLVEEGGKFIV